MKFDSHHVLSVIPELILRALSLGLLVLLTGTILFKFGVRIPILPHMEPEKLAYLCGAWWLCHR